MGPAYNEFGYNTHSLTTRSILCTKIINSNVKKFAYNKHPLIKEFLCIVLVVKNGVGVHL